VNTAPGVEQPDLDGADARHDRADESGQGMVEYALVLILVAILLILAVQVLGHQTNSLYSNISNGLGTGAGG